MTFESNAIRDESEAALSPNLLIAAKGILLAHLSACVSVSIIMLLFLGSGKDTGKEMPLAQYIKGVITKICAYILLIPRYLI
jgi:hypothetical protein